jgi:hypothetical protein
MRTAALLLAAILAAGAAAADPATVSPKGRSLAERLDAMGVETKWLAGQHVHWRTGLPTEDGETYEHGHTHCSAFVAAAAMTLGVHILRPPEHSAKLLANAQFEWLGQEGAGEGWRALPDATTAQSAANAGELVVAAYESHRADKPGHIAIVRPAARSAAELAADGPMVIQAGKTNSAAISLRDGFAGHPPAWRDQEVAYYAHEIAAP